MKLKHPEALPLPAALNRPTQHLINSVRFGFINYYHCNHLYFIMCELEQL